MKLRTFLQKWIRANVEFLAIQRRNRKIHQRADIDFCKLYPRVHSESTPCFVLSTGRCGTKLLTNILNEHDMIEAYHTPKPELIYYSKFAYEQREKKSEELKVGVDMARYEHIRDAFLSNKQFVETNNRITFFAYQLTHLYPNSKFIHIVRHPVDFIKSGLGRNWYTGKNPHDEGRITPHSGDETDWDASSPIEKIGWLWYETNRFVEDFKSYVDDTRSLTLKAEDLFSSAKTSERIFEFMGLKAVSESKINKMIKTPVNSGRKLLKNGLSVEYQNLEYLVELKEHYGYSKD